MEPDPSSRCLQQMLTLLGFHAQNPPEGSFSQNDLEWTVRKAKGDPAEFCYIPTTRLLDFIEGEMKNVHCPTSFYKKVCKSREPGSLSKPDMNSHLKSTMYWCSYGPQDLSEDQHPIQMPSQGKGKRRIKWSRGIDVAVHQQADQIGNRANTNEQQPKPIENLDSRKRSRKKKKGLEGMDHTQMKIQQPLVRRKRRLRGETYKRGCMCHFLARELYVKPEWTQIVYYQRNHVNIHGAVCHGNVHGDSLGTRYQLAPWLSKEKKEWVKCLLMEGHSCREVMRMHEHEVAHKLQMHGADSKDRDDYLDMDDINNIFDEVSKGTWKRHDNVTQSVRMWVDQNLESVFLHQEGVPFHLGILEPFQMEMLLKYGKGNAVAMAATFKINDLGFSLYTLMVFDSHTNGVPVAWILTSSAMKINIQTWLEHLKIHIHKKDPEWAPSCFIVDDADAEIGALEVVWPNIPIQLCLWHVRRAWWKVLMRHVHDPQVRNEMFKDMGDIMYNTHVELIEEDGEFKDEYRQLCARFGAARLKEFKLKWKNYVEIVAYVNEDWTKNVCSWIMVARMYARSNQEITAAVESYHAALKRRLGIFKELRGRRLDWLINMLVSDLGNHIYNRFVKENGFRLKYYKEMIVESAIFGARAIPEDAVTWINFEQGEAQVWSQSRHGTPYCVVVSDKQWSCCDCAWGTKGNICKHQVKVLQMMTNAQARGILGACGTIMGTTRGGIENLEFHEDVANMNGCEEAIEEVGCPMERVDLDEEVRIMEGKTYADNRTKLLASVARSFSHVKSTIEECPGVLHHVDFLMKEVCNEIDLLKNVSHQEGNNLIPPHVAHGKDDGTGNSLIRLRSYIDLGKKISGTMH